MIRGPFIITAAKGGALLSARTWSKACDKLRDLCAMADAGGRAHELIADEAYEPSEHAIAMFDVRWPNGDRITDTEIARLNIAEPAMRNRVARDSCSRGFPMQPDDVRPSIAWYLSHRDSSETRRFEAGPSRFGVLSSRHEDPQHSSSAPGDRPVRRDRRGPRRPRSRSADRQHGRARQPAHDPR